MVTQHAMLSMAPLSARRMVPVSHRSSFFPRLTQPFTTDQHGLTSACWEKMVLFAEHLDINEGSTGRICV